MLQEKQAPFSSYRHSQPVPLTLDSCQKGGMLGAGHDSTRGLMKHTLPRTAKGQGMPPLSSSQRSLISGGPSKN